MENKNKFLNVVINFDCSEKKINKLLKSLSLSGVRVSGIINRWAVDVPFWKKDYYLEKLIESDLIEKIFPIVTNRRINNYED